MSRVLVVAPHPDDETLGCGGTLLRHADRGDAVHWLVATAMTEDAGFSRRDRARRQRELERVAHAYPMAGVHPLGFATTRLDTLPRAELVAAVGEVLDSVRPQTLYLPHPGDAHSDHRVVFEAAAAAAKWFRRPFIRELLSYEVLSETEANPDPAAPPFRPNFYVDIRDQLARKLEILALYPEELGPFPFPRSEEAVRAKAALRGAETGFEAAEAFAVLRISCPGEEKPGPALSP